MRYGALMLFLVLLVTASFALPPAGYASCEPLTLNGSYGANHYYPLQLNSSNINYAHTATGGKDLAFYYGTCSSPTGSALGEFIQVWNSSGNSIVDLNLSTANATNLAMFYNNPSATSLSNLQNVLGSSIVRDYPLNGLTDYAEGYNLTNHAGLAVLVPGRRGWDSAYSFGSVGTYLIGSDAGLPTGTNAWTACAWINSSTAQYSQIVQEYGAAVGGEGRYPFISSFGSYGVGNYQVASFTSNTYPFGTWALFCAEVQPGGNWEIITEDLNSGLSVSSLGTLTGTNTVLGGSTGLQIGGDDDAGWIQGPIQDVEDWNTNLSIAQIQSLWAFPEPTYAFGPEQSTGGPSVSLTLSSPTATTYYTNAIPINATCTGSDTNYQLNITDNVTGFLFSVPMTSTMPYSTANYCYQESVNITNQTGIDGNCGLNYTGSWADISPFGGGWNNLANLFSGNWNLGATPIGTGIVTITYEKPVYATINSLWETYGTAPAEGPPLYQKNLSMPSSCWNANPSAITFQITAIAGNVSSSITWACFNGTGFTTLRSDIGDVGTPRVYGQAMEWSFTPDLVIGPHTFTAVCGNANATANATVSFGVNNTIITPISPIPSIPILGTSATLSYSINSTYESQTCGLYLDNALQYSDSAPVGLATFTHTITGLAAGPHSWYVSCPPITSPASSFILNAPGLYPNTINFSAFGSENIYPAPQTLFYDSSGNLNLLYYAYNGTQNMRLLTIAGNSIIANHSAPMNFTAPFFVAIREPNDTGILAFDNVTHTEYYAQFGNAGLNLSFASSGYAAASNAWFDPYSYASTNAYPRLTFTGNSYYLFLLPANGSTYLIRKNATTPILTSVASTSFASVAWQSIANDSTLDTWLYAFPAAGSGCDYIDLYSYNGTGSTYLAQPDTNCYTAAQIANAKVSFASYNGYTYAMITNATNYDIIYRMNDGANVTIPYQVGNPSTFFFVDNQTFVFFDNSTGTNYAYSCYFGQSPANCIQLSAAAYGASIPYYAGGMTAATRINTSDVVTNGEIISAGTPQFIYNQEIYDAKFTCLDEMSEFREPFITQITGASTSQTLNTSVWGYVLPSSMIGPGFKTVYSVCYDPLTSAYNPEREFLLGLNSNYYLPMYSLNNASGAYFTFKILDSYNQPISNVTITAMRFSPSNGAYVTIEQGVTDVTGSTIFFLQPSAIYQVTASANGYVPMAFQYQPISSTQTITVVLSTAGSYVNLPTFDRVFNDVSYSITPMNTYFPTDPLITYQIASTNATLVSYGMTVTQEYNGTLTTVFNQTVTNQPAGGILTYNMSSTGVYTIYTSFQDQNYSTFLSTPITVYMGAATGLAEAAAEFNSSPPISGWVFYLAALIVTMIVAGFVSMYSVDGAGLVGLAVLWGFTYFYPGGLVVATLGITILDATVLTTVMVLAGFYLMHQG